MEQDSTVSSEPEVLWAALATAAWEARERAYAPYSGFFVGAAIRGLSGGIYAGANVENLSFGLTICAERVAIGAAIAAGEREFEAIAVVADSQQPISPCGACRQVMAEFAPSLQIHCENRQGVVFRANLEELLPRATTGILG